MYDIRLDGKPLWYPGDGEAVIINPELHEALNDAGYIQLTVPETNPLYNDIKERISMVQVYKDDVMIFNAEVREVTINSIKDKKVYAVGELAFLSDSIQPQHRYQNRTVLQVFETMLAEHNAQVESKKQFVRGVVTVTDANDSLYRYTNYEDTLTAMREKLCDTLDGYLRVRYQDGIRYLDFVTLDDYGKTCRQPIKFGANLLEYASNSTGADIATAIIPLGAKLEESEIEGLDAYTTIKSVNDGKDYIYSKEAVEQFGWVKKVVNWDDVTEPANLLKKAKVWLEQNQFANLTLELKALDLSILSRKMESMEIGDRIRAIAEPYGMDTWFPLQEKVTYLQHPENNTLTLSNTAKKTYTAQANKANAELKQEIPQQKSLVQMMQENASNLIKTATNGNIVMKMDDTGNPVELLIMDTKDIATAKNVWRWNLNGFGYSSNGYDGDYDTAITMDGKIVADFIAAGTMIADRIRGGTLEIGGTNNNNGVIKIVNAAGKVLVMLDNSGITLDSSVQIAWGNISGTENVASTSDIPTKTSELENDSDLAYTDDIPTDDYITQITKDTITAAFIKALNLEVGNHIKMGANATISWDNVTGTDDVANTDDIPTDAHITQITENTVTTEFINALKITAKNVNAGEIKGCEISGGRIHQETSAGYEIGNPYLNIENGVISGGFGNTELGSIGFELWSEIELESGSTTDEETMVLRADVLSLCANKIRVGSRYTESGDETYTGSVYFTDDGTRKRMDFVNGLLTAIAYA